MSKPTGRPSQRRKREETFVEKEKEKRPSQRRKRPSQRRKRPSQRTKRPSQRRKRPSQRRGMRNFPRLAYVQVLSFGYSRDMLEYPRREECGCFSKGKRENTLLSPRIEQPGTQTLTMWNGQLALEVCAVILRGSWKGSLVLPRLAYQLFQFMWDDQE